MVDGARHARVRVENLERAGPVGRRGARHSTARRTRGPAGRQICDQLRAPVAELRSGFGGATAGSRAPRLRVDTLALVRRCTCPDSALVWSRLSGHVVVARAVRPGIRTLPPWE